MPCANLTCKLVDNVALPIGRKSVEYFDHRMPGLVLRVSARGTKSWNAIYRHHGRARRLTIGRYPVITLDDARARARDALCSVSRGIDPSGVRADKLTFAELASIFVAGHVCKLRRARQVERLIEREIVVAWKNRPASRTSRNARLSWRTASLRPRGASSDGPLRRDYLKPTHVTRSNDRRSSVPVNAFSQPASFARFGGALTPLIPLGPPCSACAC